MLKNITFLSCFLFLGIIYSSSAQTFKASLLLGVNFSDLYDDAGFDSHLGLNAGIKVGAQLKKKWAISTAFLLSQQSDYLIPSSAPTVKYDRLFLNFIEVPVQMEYRYYPQSGGYYRGVFTFGLGYARLVHFIAIGEGGIDHRDDIVFKNRNTSFFHLGAGGLFTKHLGIHFRGALSTNLTWTLAIRGIYII